MKYCSKCKETLPVTKFYTHRTSKDKLQHYCKQCQIKMSMEWSKSEKGKAYRKSEKGYTSRRRIKIRHRYGIEADEIPDKCETCNSTQKICVDHNATTGHVRGFLCDLCNRALGYVKENPITLRKLAIYIEERNNGVCK